MPGERLVDLGEQRLDRRDVRTADAVLVDQRREGAILPAAHPFGVWRICADAATVDLDRVAAPVGEEEAASSEERRGGEECVSTCRSRGSSDIYKKKTT